MPLPASVIGELKKVAGRDHVITALNDLRIFERDGSIEGAVPDAIVLPSNTEQVAAVIKVAARHNIPIVPRGAGTGLSGGAVPSVLSRKITPDRWALSGVGPPKLSSTIGGVRKGPFCRFCIQPRRP